MGMKNWIESVSLKNTALYYRLNIIIGLFFLFPILSFLYFCIRYDILTDTEIPLFLLGILIFSFFGMTMLRALFDDIKDLSKTVSQNFAESSRNNADVEESEMKRLIRSFDMIQQQFGDTFRKLEKKTHNISILKELSDLCYVTFDSEEIMYVTLERALAITDSEIGSILMLEKAERNTFIVKACIGLEGYVTVGDRIDFETSIAKYAVINKTPLLVQDIEKDRRFGRTNRPQYGTKSFVCMPIKTSKDIIGVLTLSRKDQDRIYQPEDIEPLVPLLTNAAFMYENLRLIRDKERLSQYLNAVGKFFKVLNSSLRGGELVNALLSDFREIISFDIVLVLMRSENHPEHITLLDFIGESGHLTRGMTFPSQGSVIGAVLKQRSSVIVADMKTLSSDTDRQLLVQRNIASCMIVPLKTDGLVKGVLILCRSEDSAAFYAGKNMIEQMANGLSVAIERDSLLSSVLQRKQELDSIRQIGRALASSTFDIEKVLSYTMDMIRVMINAEAGTLYLVDGDMIENAVSFNIFGKQPDKFRLRIGQGIAGYVAAQGQAVIVNDTGTSPHFYDEMDKITSFQTHSALCVPIISQGKIMGVLEVINKVNSTFGTNDEDLLQSIASSVSVAIENARLYKETVAMAEHERDIRRIFQKFVPEKIVDKIIYGSETGKMVVNELKIVTLLNIDIRGFSKIAKKIGPQKTVAMLNGFFSTMGAIVFKYHGIVDKYLGDGFLALFGSPVSGDADADNAISAALEMKAAIGDISSFCLKEFKETVVMGISIHTGEVVVGNIGFDMKMDYTVIGDSVNSVFRLQNVAKAFPDGILISEDACRAALSHPKIRKVEERVVQELESRLEGIRVFELIGMN